MPIMVDMIAPVTPVRPGVGTLAVEAVPVPVEEPGVAEPAEAVAPLSGV